MCSSSWACRDLASWIPAPTLTKLVNIDQVRLMSYPVNIESIIIKF